MRSAKNQRQLQFRKGKSAKGLATAKRVDFCTVRGIVDDKCNCIRTKRETAGVALTMVCEGFKTLFRRFCESLTYATKVEADCEKASTSVCRKVSIENRREEGEVRKSTQGCETQTRRWCDRRSAC